jgi:hypothetical protein
MTDEIYKAPESDLGGDNKSNQYWKDVRNDLLAIIVCVSFIYIMWLVLPYRNIFITCISVILVFYALMSVITLPINYFKYKKSTRSLDK